MKNIVEFLNESEEILKPNDVNRELLPDDERYAVIFIGGTMADAVRQTFRCGADRCTVSKDNMTEEEAKAMAKRWNGYLTSTEKKYYGMKYKAVLSAKIKPI